MRTEGMLTRSLTTHRAVLLAAILMGGTTLLLAIPLPAPAAAPTTPAVEAVPVKVPSAQPGAADAAAEAVRAADAALAAGDEVAVEGEASPGTPPPPATQVVENPYGLDSLWKQGDFVARGTLLILLIMSMGSWYIMITKVFEQYRLLRQAQAANETFWTAGSLQQGVKGLNAHSPFRFIAESGVRATEHHEGLLDRIDLHTWMTMSIQRAVERIQSRLQEGLAFLATVGSTAPFIGLFGTVWGIYHALTAIGIAGQASIDKVAGPVGEALIMTAFGLAVAVPAVLAYNWLVRRNKVAMEKVRAFGADLHSVLISAGQNGARDGERISPDGIEAGERIGTPGLRRG
jgi:biopolymer transport protein ExbB